jgi:DNA-binding PadR family transcriptional regulator
MRRKSRLTVYTDCRYVRVMSLREPTFFILTALVEQPLHGYGVMKAVHDLSDGRLTLRAGTLYAAFDRLVEDGLLAVDREETVDGRLRRYYRLTDAGAAVLDAEISRLRANATIAAGRLRGRAGGLPAMGLGR